MNQYPVLLVLLFLYMSAWFIVALLKKRNDVADTAWGMGFVLMAWASYFLSDGAGIRGLVVSVLVSIWGGRLAWHVYNRNKGKPEDYRYLAWRNEWRKWFLIRSYLQVFLLQGVLLFLIAIPVFSVNIGGNQQVGLLDFMGLAVWCIGFFFEVVGDAQLAAFIRNPSNKGKLMQSGLWAFTRHPNYFGEVTMWWGIWLVACSTPDGWVSVVGPMTITFLILKVSGVPLLEKNMEKKPEFAEYKRRVSVFIPLPPKVIR